MGELRSQPKHCAFLRGVGAFGEVEGKDARPCARAMASKPDLASRNLRGYKAERRWQDWGTMLSSGTSYLCPAKGPRAPSRVLRVLPGCTDRSRCAGVGAAGGRAEPGQLRFPGNPVGSPARRRCERPGCPRLTDPPTQERWLFLVALSGAEGTLPCFAPSLG